MPISVQGNLIVTPQAVVTVDDSGLSGPGQGGSGDLIIVGVSQGGKPLTPLYFRTPVDAKSTLLGGDGLRAVLRAFSPAPGFVGAPRVIFVRANVGTQSTLTLNDASGKPSIVLTSRDYGSQTNLIRINISPGTTQGRKISVAQGTNVLVRDNILRNGLKITYSGTNQPTASIGPVTTLPQATTLATAATAGTGVTLTVGSSTTFQPGQQILIGYQGSATAEVATITAVPSGTTITVQSLANAHAVGEPLAPYQGQQGLAVFSKTSAGTPVPGESVVLPFAQFQTIQSLADALNSLASGVYAVQVLTPSPLDPSTGLDSIPVGMSLAGSGGVVLSMNLYACILALNDNAQPFVTAAAAPGAGQPPAIFASPTTWLYLSGGADGNVPPSASDWTNAFTVASEVDCSVICVATGDPTVHAMLQTHVDVMSTLEQRMERIAIVGGVAGETIQQAINRANALRDMRVGLVYPGILDYDPLNPGTTPIVLDPWLVAAQLGGMFCGGPIQDALTNRYIAARGVEVVLSRSDVDNLQLAGVIPIAQRPRKGWAVAHSLSTWIADTNYRHTELSVMRASDYIVKTVRNALDPLVGRINAPETLLLVLNTTATTLSDLTKQGVLVGDAIHPSYRNLQVTGAGDVITVSFEAAIAIPANYIVATIRLVPYSGTISA